MGRRRDGTNSRALGINPRALGTNPRIVRSESIAEDLVSEGWQVLRQGWPFTLAVRGDSEMLLAETVRQGGTLLVEHPAVEDLLGRLQIETRVML
jgi:hypothetical protein